MNTATNINKQPTVLAAGVAAKDSVHCRKAMSDSRPSRSRKKAKPEGGEGDATASAARAGRTSQFAGKTIKTEQKANPRRAGTAGHRSFEIVLKAGAAGITYEDYRKAGGRSNDLQWDVDHEYVTVS